MHTIEASVLVPMGLGLISLLLMLTFFIHDQTVLTAECSSAILEWQMCPGAWNEEECRKETSQWEESLLITRVDAEYFSAGKTVCCLRTKEEYRLFDSALNLLEQSFLVEQEKPAKTVLKINPCWSKRVWEVVMSE